MDPWKLALRFIAKLEQNRKRVWYPTEMDVDVEHETVDLTWTHHDHVKGHRQNVLVWFYIDDDGEPRANLLACHTGRREAFFNLSCSDDKDFKRLEKKLVPLLQGTK